MVAPSPAEGTITVPLGDVEFAIGHYHRRDELRLYPKAFVDVLAVVVDDFGGWGRGAWVTWLHTFGVVERDASSTTDG
jgi:hypothetical protein